MSDKTPRAPFEVWAVARRGDTAVMRASYWGLPGARSEAQAIARSAPNARGGGAVSVWIQDRDGDVIWSAGEKWTELHPGGAS
jgi:hypothetical protein